MLYGPDGEGGKSTLLNILAQLVGRENASFLFFRTPPHVSGLWRCTARR